ncbi:MAG: class I SAM-dependent methyltransferase [Acutalibacteraceae bacterium]
MDKSKIISFFDRCALSWDENATSDRLIVEKILLGGKVEKGSEVLDVACGTGILFPYYKSVGVGSVTGIDISSEMVKIAKSKFPESEIICGDAESYSFEKQFDCIMIYNAFPHFENPRALFKNLSLYMKQGATITVAHGMSEKALQKHHANVPCEVSSALPSKEQMKTLMEEFFKVELMVSDEKMYQVTAIKK